MGGTGGMTCGQCRGEAFEPGFIEDSGGDYAAKGYLRWIPGPLKTGLFGAARRFGKTRVQIDAFRCTACGHLELFVPQPQ